MGLLTLFIDIGLLVAGAIALGIAAGFVASAAAQVTKVSKWKKDHDMKKAHTYLSWSATFGWVGLAVIITLIVLYVIFGSESIEFTAGLVSKGMLLLTIGILILTGSFAAVGASYIDKSPNSDEAKKNGGYRQAIIAAVLSLVAGALIIGLFLYLMFHKPKSKKNAKKDEKKKNVEDKVDELKNKLIEEKEAAIEEKEAAIEQRTATLQEKTAVSKERARKVTSRT